MNLRETTVREIFKTQKSRDKLEAKKQRQKQQRTNKNRKKTHRKLKMNEQPVLHHSVNYTIPICRPHAYVSFRLYEKTTQINIIQQTNLNETHVILIWSGQFQNYFPIFRPLA
jgi:hypothetical protein